MHPEILSIQQSQKVLIESINFLEQEIKKLLNEYDDIKNTSKSASKLKKLDGKMAIFYKKLQNEKKELDMQEAKFKAIKKRVLVKKKRMTRKLKMYVIVDKKNSPKIYGSFPKSKDGKLLALSYLEKIQKEHLASLFIEIR